MFFAFYPFAKQITLYAMLKAVKTPINRGEPAVREFGSLLVLNMNPCCHKLRKFVKMPLSLFSDNIRIPPGVAGRHRKC